MQALRKESKYFDKIGRTRILGRVNQHQRLWCWFPIAHLMTDRHFGMVAFAWLGCWIRHLGRNSVYSGCESFHPVWNHTYPLTCSGMQISILQDKWASNSRYNASLFSWKVDSQVHSSKLLTYKGVSKEYVGKFTKVTPCLRTRLHIITISINVSFLAVSSILDELFSFGEGSTVRCGGWEKP